MRHIYLSSIHKSFGGEAVIRDVTFEINDNRRYGLIGANGSGKTTILRILTGHLQADRGNVFIEPGLSIGFVPQFPEFALGSSVRHALTAVVEPLESALRRAEELLSVAGPESIDGAMKRYQRARDAWDEADGDSIMERSETLLSQSILASRMDSPVDGLSGGEKNILGLLRALLIRPDMLILDEPGNHLDYRGLAWLEELLTGFPGAVLAVSHNRYLLDRVATDILELSQGTVTHYRGNYSAYRIEQLKSASARQAAYAANQQTLRRIEEMVRRFAVIAASRPDPAWGKRLRAAKSRLAQEEDRAVERPDISRSQIRPDFRMDSRKGDVAVRICGFTLVRGEKKLLEHADLEITRGMRTALMGPNGSGKTSLLEELTAKASWDDDQLKIVDSLKVGYIMQHPETAATEGSLEDEVRGWGALSRDQAFALIKPMNFEHRDMEKSLANLSGGELNRLQIARIMYEKPDILIMDEPTNHLDIPSREALEQALDDYRGTLIVVSHDRYFLDRVADHIAEIRDKQLVLYNGSFSEYHHHILRGSAASPGSGGKAFPSPGRGSSPAAGKDNGQPHSTVPDAAALERRIQSTESTMVKLESDIRKALEKGDHQRGRQLSAKLEKEKKLLDDLYVRWEKSLSDR